MAHSLIAVLKCPGARRRAALLGALLVGDFALGASDPPPGLLRVDGGPTWIGTEVGELERLVARSPARAAALFDELELHQVDVATFDLMVTEVTNEQFAIFVRATGARPPVTFCPSGALDRARTDFVEAKGRRFREARADGRPAPEPSAFDPDAWWDAQWHEQTWRIPPGQAGHPVSSVSASDAQAYATWAGLRLMTELEYQRAARASSRRAFAFEGEFSAERAASIESARGEPQRVGSFPPTGGGFFDLAGNVWELTASPYEPYSTWSVQSIDVPHAGGQRLVRGFVPWDANQRIVVGGSAAGEAIALRASNRRPIGPSERRDLVGFRCAASPEPVRDRARSVLLERAPAQRTGHVFDAQRAVGSERWHHEHGEVPAPGYASITGYEALCALPVEHVDAGGLIALRNRTRARGPLPIAFVHQTIPSLEPPLPAGDYVVLFRGAGHDRSAPGEREVRVVLPTELETDRDQWLFLDAVGRIAGHRPCPEIAHVRNRAGAAEHSPAGVVRYTLSIPDAPGSRHGFRVTLELSYDAQALDGPWRRTVPTD